MSWNWDWCKCVSSTSWELRFVMLYVFSFYEIEWISCYLFRKMIWRPPLTRWAHALCGFPSARVQSWHSLTSCVLRRLQEVREHSIQWKCIEWGQLAEVWPTSRDSGVGNRTSSHGAEWDIYGLDSTRTIWNLVLPEKSENLFVGLGGLSPWQKHFPCGSSPAHSSCHLSQPCHFPLTRQITSVLIPLGSLVETKRYTSCCHAVS